MVWCNMDLIKGFVQGFKDFGKYINNGINFVLLLLVYLFGVGLTSIVAKICGKHFMDIKRDTKKKTYWKDYNLGKEPEDNYYRQF